MRIGRRFFYSLLAMAALSVIFRIYNPTAKATEEMAAVIDGDTIRIGKDRIRLAFIDTPEHNAPGFVEASSYMASLLKEGPPACILLYRDHYGRAVAKCSVQGRDLAASMVQNGFAVPWYGFPYWPDFIAAWISKKGLWTTLSPWNPSSTHRRLQ